MAIDDETWGHVRHAYCDTALSVPKICNQFGITQKALYARRAAEGWPARGTAPPKVDKPRPSGGSPPPVATNHKPAVKKRSTRSGMIRRLYEAIDTKLTQMERQMTGTSETSAADHERETRALSTLIQTFERMLELDPAARTKRDQPTRAHGPAGSAADTGTRGTAIAAETADAERLRREIADRVERLLGGGPSAGSPG
jgi:transposase-like protein